jgi:hypothetical protein
MTMKPLRYPDRPAPISARERPIPFGPIAEMDLAAIADPAQTHQTSGFRASRLEHCAADPRLALTRRPGGAAKSP